MMAANSENGAVVTDKDVFDFDAPQFTDLNIINSEDGNLLEEDCQSYFDHKTEETKRKSDELDKELMAQQKFIHNKEKEKEQQERAGMEHQEDVTVVPGSDNDENLTTESIANLLPATEFANLSLLSSQFQRNNKNNKSSRGHHKTVSSRLHSINKTNKSQHALSTKELQFQRMKAKKMELEKLKEKNAKNVAKMKDSRRVFHPIRTTKLTVPIAPALQTTLRAQERNKEKEYTPLHSTRSHSASGASPAAAIKSAASNRSASTTAGMTTRHQPFGLTKRKPRKKMLNVQSMEKKELREVEQHNKFQARKINPKIFKSNAANLGILNNLKNKVTTTTVQPFRFLTEQRARKHQEMKKSNI